MQGSLARLQELAARGAGATQHPIDLAGLQLLASNLEALETALDEAQPPDGRLTPAQHWRNLVRVFDEHRGQDMRELLSSAVVRKGAASEAENRRLDATLAAVRTGSAVLAVIVLLSCVVAVVYFLRTIERPFAALVRVTEQLGQGDYAARSGLSGRDEFARIGTLIDSMAERLRQAHAASAVLQQRLDTLVRERTRAVSQAYETLTGIEARRRRFFAELSHELRTPVTVIRGEAEIALRQAQDGDAMRLALERIAEAAVDLAARVQDLLDAARLGAADYDIRPKSLELVEVGEAATQQMQAVAQYRGVALEFEHPPGDLAAWVAGDRERLQQALAIVLDNAITYSPVGGRVTVRVVDEEEGWALQVDDEGPGMDDDEIERAFEPHFRGRAAVRLEARGAGLGLSIAQRILAAHRGILSLERRSPRGLRATLVLQRAGEQVES
jgi:signal transduction histidine kinase